MESFFCEEDDEAEKNNSSENSALQANCESPNAISEFPESQSMNDLESSTVKVPNEACDQDEFFLEEDSHITSQKSPLDSSAFGSATERIGVSPLENVADHLDKVAVTPPPVQSEDALDHFEPVFSEKVKLETLKRLSIAKATLNPTLHGKPGEMLELDEEFASKTDCEHKKVQNLIERFVQQVNYTKASPKERDIQIK